VSAGFEATHSCCHVEALGFVTFADSGYGFFVSMRPPDIADTIALVQTAFARDMLLVPGGMFSPGGKPSPWLRCNVAQTGKPVINALQELLALR